MPRNCVLILPLILVLHLNCNGWCNQSEHTVPASAQSCHDMPMDDGDRPSTPFHHQHGLCDECLLLQAVESRTPAPNFQKVTPVAVLITHHVTQLQEYADASGPGFESCPSFASPPSRQILRI